METENLDKSYPELRYDSINRSSALPYYVQLKELIRDKIEHGEWKPGDQLPSEPDLCEMFGISRTVIRQALKELTYEGLIYREKGKGTFIAEPKIVERLVSDLTGFFQDMTDRGYKPYSRVLRQELTTASQKIAKLLDLPQGSEVIELSRLRFVEDEPITLVTTFLPYKLCPNVLTADLSHQSLYSFLEKECGFIIARGRRIIEAVPANAYEAELLNVETGVPLILLDSVSYLADGTPIEYYHALHRGDRARFSVELMRYQPPMGTGIE
ncbi:MAG TPA: GntR family transcriptional regulator, partial [Anaerolineaceae bacterium]|nr:GntR family transcriptional regulator [Anaerolineaceae bacterium]